MNLKFGIDDRPRFGQLMLYSLQWFVLAIAVVTTSLFIAVGSPAERVLYAQKVFALMGVTTIIQVFFGHRMPIVVGPAAVLLVGIITALASQGAQVDTDRIYTSLIVGGALVAVIAAGSLLKHLQRIFTPRIVVVILMLIAMTLSPTIRNLIFPAGEEPRPSGIPAISFCSISGVRRDETISVRISPGASTFDVTPYGAPRLAKPRERACIADFAAA